MRRPPRAPAASPDATPLVLRPTREVRLRVARQRLGMLLALFACGLQLATAVETTAFQWPFQLDLAWWAPDTVALAAARGLPIGYFLAFALRRRGALGRSVAAGVALGVALELCALAGGRTVTPLTIPCVALGALVGAVGFLLLARRLRARATNDAVLLAPDLPLVGGAYVAAPLLWLRASTGAGFEAFGPRWGLVLLTLYGASLIGSARASRGPAGGGLAAHALAAAAWAAFGLSPLVGRAPLAVASLVAAAAVFAALHPLLLGMRGRDRRVEGPALRRSLPLLGLYLVLSSLGPLAGARAGQPGASDMWAVLAASIPVGGWTELAAALAVLGYALTELLGRREDAGIASWRLVGPIAAAVGGTSAALRVAADAHGTLVASGLHFAAGWLLSVAAARTGAWLYELQRRHARAHKVEGPGVRGGAAGGARRAERTPEVRSA